MKMWRAGLIILCLVCGTVNGSPQGEDTPELGGKAPANHEIDYHLWELHSSSSESPTVDDDNQQDMRKLNYQKGYAPVKKKKQPKMKGRTMDDDKIDEKSLEGDTNAKRQVMLDDDTASSEGTAVGTTKEKSGVAVSRAESKDGEVNDQQQSQKMKRRTGNDDDEDDDDKWEGETKAQDMRKLNYQKGYAPVKKKKQPKMKGRTMDDDEIDEKSLEGDTNVKRQVMLDDETASSEVGTTEDKSGVAVSRAESKDGELNDEQKSQKMKRRTAGNDDDEDDDDKWEGETKAQDVRKLNYQKGYAPVKKKKQPKMKGRTMDDDEIDEESLEGDTQAKRQVILDDDEEGLEGTAVETTEEREERGLNEKGDEEDEKGQDVTDSDVQNTTKLKRGASGDKNSLGEDAVESDFVKIFTNVKPEASSVKDKFVVLERLSTGKEIERQVRFDISALTEEQGDHSVDVDRLKRQNNENPMTQDNNQTTPSPNLVTTMKPPLKKSNARYAEIANAQGKKYLHLLDNETLERLRLLPNDTNYTSGSIYIQYSHHLTALERAGDTEAKPGDLCAPKTIFDPDYCERAAYPNKNKMFCYSGINDTNDNFNLTKNTCACKFYRTSEEGREWKQLKFGLLNINGQEVPTCLVPKFGVCNHRVSTGLKDKKNRSIYEVDVCQGHFQCDNTPYLEKLANKVGKEVKRAYILQKHCSEQDFIDQFTSDVQSKVLVCSKPNPRRFKDYDEFKYYCLPKESRDLEQRHFKPINVDFPLSDAGENFESEDDLSRSAKIDGEKGVPANDKGGSGGEVERTHREANSQPGSE